jgi:hypothetical protein
VKNAEKVEKSATIPERLRQAQDYEEFLKSSKAQKLEQQKVYKEFLDKQAAGQVERELINKMTREEKKLNFNDLQVACLGIKGFLFLDRLIKAMIASSLL